MVCAPTAYAAEPCWASKHCAAACPVAIPPKQLTPQKPRHTFKHQTPCPRAASRTVLQPHLAWRVRVRLTFLCLAPLAALVAGLDLRLQLLQHQVVLPLLVVGADVVQQALLCQPVPALRQRVASSKARHVRLVLCLRLRPL